MYANPLSKMQFAHAQQQFLESLLSFSMQFLRTFLYWESSRLQVKTQQGWEASLSIHQAKLKAEGAESTP